MRSKRGFFLGALTHGLAVACLASLAAAMAIPAPAQDVMGALQNYQSSITVYGDRLPATERQLLNTAAPIAVVTRDQIEESGARTVQQALETLPSIVLHNETGNPRESSVDLRAFPDGESVAVFLDGVRLNDLQDNSVRLDIIPVEDLERIEVYAGASAPLYGGGALGGVINLVTKRDPGIPRLDLEARAGSYGEEAGRIHAAGSYKALEFYATGQTARSDGWRQNDGYRLDDALARFNLSLPSGQSLALLMMYDGGRENDPGSLTAIEYAQNPRQSPYNLYDYSRGRRRIASLGYSASPGGGWNFEAQAYSRKHDRDTLTTGRFGSGFFTTGSESLGGGVASARNRGARNNWSWDCAVGAEAASGRFDGSGYYTDIHGLNKVAASQSSVGEHLAGAWTSLDGGYGKFHLIAGFRADRTSYDYSDGLAASNDASRVFRENTRRFGLLCHVTPESSLFLTFSEGYRIPTVVDLFAYPGFYSNPDLVPSRARDWEMGWRYIKGGLRLSFTAFRMDVNDEVVFVLTDPQWFIGQNQNVAASRRRGLEAQANVPIGMGFSAFAEASYTETLITKGPYASSRVPMTPRGQGTIGGAWNWHGWTAQLSMHFVGPQLYDNDLANTRPELGGYATADMSASYHYRAMTVRASVTNLLDHRYAGRGITNGYQDFLTPAYPMTARLSFMWSF